MAERARGPVVELTRWRDRCTRLVSTYPDAFVEVDLTGRIVEWNPRAEELFGWRRDEVIGRHAGETVLPARLGGSPFGHTVESTGVRPTDDAMHRFQLADRSGQAVDVEASVFTTGYGTSRSVSGFLRSVDEVAFRSPEPDHKGDETGGLPDRLEFTAALIRALEHADGKPGSVAVALLDLDRFKVINGSLGQDAGDRVLLAVANRLSKLASRTDLVARFGGDGFVAAFVDDGGRAQRRALEFVEDARFALHGPISIVGKEVFLDASAGIALNTFGVAEAAELMANAEAAMYRAKRRGGGGVEIFREPMRIETLDRMATEHSLHRAVDKRELTLYYQPVVEVAGATAVGVEALIRWHHPDQGLLPANRFIPVAEESGLIIPIGTWVLQEACEQLREWRSRKRRGKKASMEVNLSARQIADTRIVATVEQVLSRTGLPPDHLTLEITESALMQDSRSSLEVLRALKRVGVQLAIDDFGTGYSSLSYLQRFPVDILKVDCSFIEQLGVRPQSEEIVSSVISLAHALGLEVVAEGVETVQQLEILRSLGCDLAQGYLFSVPRPASEIADSFPLPMSA
jgi:diguanylate cyclase (GGDEF)-like protein/PAS domain S-box-containing protein